MAEVLRPALGRVNDNVRNFTNVRRRATAKSPVVFRMDKGSTCTVLEEARGKKRRGKPWYRVEQNGKRGYAVARNIDILVREGRVNDNVQRFTNVRAGAETDEAIVFRMDRGSTCTVLGEVEGKEYKGKPWYWVEQDGKRGYSVAHNIDIVPLEKAPLEMPHHGETESAQGIRPDSDYSAKVTEHITYGEIAMYQEERRFENQGQCDVCLEICLFLEQVRRVFGDMPITITSGNRPPAVNERAGGASSSEHLYRPGAGAVDFLIENANLRQVQAYCDKNWPYSVGYGAPKGFVHLGIRAGRPRVRWDY